MTSNPDPKDVQPHWWCPTCKKVSAYLVVDYDADPKVTEWRCSCGFARNCAVIAMDGKANQLLSGAIAELESSLASALRKAEQRRTYCHLCHQFFDGEPDGHGLGECVWTCLDCMSVEPEDGKDLCKTCQELASARAEIERLRGCSDGMCHTCREQTQSLAGNPSLWPIALPFIGGNGDSRTYHMGCVVKALADSERKDALLREAGALSQSPGTL